MSNQDQPTVQTLPVLPLRDVVVFPGTAMPLYFGRSSALKALAKANSKEPKQIIVVAQKDAEKDDPQADDLYSVGTLCTIRSIQKTEESGQIQAQIIIDAMERVTLSNLTFGETLEASYDVMPVPADAPDAETKALMQATIEKFEDVLKVKKSKVPPEILADFKKTQSPSALADKLAATATEDLLSLGIAKKQELLEMISPQDRLFKIAAACAEQIDLAKLQKDLQEKIKAKMDKQQREYFLRNQREVIDEELGEDGKAEIDEYTARIEQSGMPHDIREKAFKELDKLDFMSPMSAEAGVIRNYLDELLSLPFSEYSDVNYDLDGARETLDSDHYGLEQVKEQVLENIAVQKRLEKNRQAVAEKKQELEDTRELLAEREEEMMEREQHDIIVPEDPADEILEGEMASLRDKLKSLVKEIDSMTVKNADVLCLVGPPGVGKTSICQSLAKATGRQYVRMSAGGVRDEAEIRGHRRTYIGARPGKITKKIQEAGTMNPLFVIDEIDKMGSDHRGDPSSAMLEVLDPEQNSSFEDHYLEAPLDLSNVKFVCTANVWGNIPGPLRDRMETVFLGSYTEDEKLEIAHRHLVRKQMKATGLEENELSITKDALRDLVRYYTREAGVRGLQREINKLCRKAVIALNKPGVDTVEITADNLTDYAGKHKVEYDQIKNAKDRVGVVNGLAYTEVGGETLKIEASKLPNGKGIVSQSGQLGDVMKESITAATVLLKSQASEFGVDLDKDVEKFNFHVHVPAGATPKDGPSAGAAMLTAIFSAATGRAVRKDVAMTGEITTIGDVTAIGGLREKLAAASRAGCTTVIIPQENEKDLDEVPQSIKDALDIHPVSHVSEVLKIALVGGYEPTTSPANDDKDVPSLLKAPVRAPHN